MAITEADVKKIYPTDSDLSGYLRTANLVVTSQLSDKGLDSSIQDEIAIYLTAHFATIGLDKGGLRRQRLGDGDESYKTPGDKDLGFKSTLFGQQAMLLDSSGTLASMGANSQTLPALFTVFGLSGGEEATSC